MNTSEKKSKQNILFVLGGLAMGGVETYIVRLARELSLMGNRVELLLLSDKFDLKLMLDVTKHAKVTIFENTVSLSASSWINAFLPLNKRAESVIYDIVHVVDILTLGFVFLNKDMINFRNLSIGIYHSMELSWWRNKKVYFRTKLLHLYDKNVSLTLFPNETTARLAGEFAKIPVENLSLLPLGIELAKYQGCSPSKDSLRIISVGRLVDFKIYNKHVISQLRKIRELNNFEYFIYGRGPEEKILKDHAIKEGVSDFVHFMGEVSYDDLPGVLNSSFCFIGSGTTIIEAAAAGIPGIVGIESIKSPHTCGLFSDVIGYSYNEESATDKRITFYDAIKSLNSMSNLAYALVSESHRKKSTEFDLQVTAEKFLILSCNSPDFQYSLNRWLALISFFYSITRYGPRSLKDRFQCE